MSPKPKRQENVGLPARWRFKHGAYYYRVPAEQDKTQSRWPTHPATTAVAREYEKRKDGE